MIVYVAIAVYSILFAFILGCDNQASPEAKKRYLFVLGLLLTIVSGFRGTNIGIDTETYLQLFQMYAQRPWTDLFGGNVEPGYVLLNKITSVVCDNSQGIILVSSALICFGISRFAAKTSKNLMISMFLFITMYCYGTSFNAMRQYIAIALTCNAMVLLTEKRRIASIILILIATSFHLASAVFLPLCLMTKTICKPKWIVFILVCAIVATAEVNTLLTLVATAIPKYRYLLTYDYYLQARGLDINVIMYLAEFLFLILYASQLFKKERAFYKLPRQADSALTVPPDLRETEAVLPLDKAIIFLMTSFSLILQIGSISFRGLSRPNYFFQIFFIIAIPNYIEEYMHQYRVIVYFVMFVCLMAYFILMLSHNNHGICPYELCF